MTAELDQALFGYDRGHRLIASSRKLDKDSTYVLRTATDMKVGRRAHYLTVMPVPAIGVHAFIRTWAASSTFRPGSVWSHVLLLASQDVGRVDDFRTITQLFKRPNVNSIDQLSEIQSIYCGTLRWPSAPFDDHSQSNDGVPPPPALVNQLVLAAYGHSEYPLEVVADDVATAEDAVLGLMGQQWAELRKFFSARTRHRPSPNLATPFAIEVVERGSSISPSVHAAVEDWVKLLSDDLDMPNLPLRTFLGRYGPDGGSGRDDVAPLAEVFVAAGADLVTTVEVLWRHYSAPMDMDHLKRELFSPSGRPAGLDRWESNGSARLQALLRYAPGMVALTEIEARSTVAQWARTDPQAAVVAVASSDRDRLSASDVLELTGGLRDGAPSDWIGRAAVAMPELAAALLKERADAWCLPEVWTSEIDHDDLLQLIFSADQWVREATFRELLRAGLAGSAAELCQREASLWWSVLDAAQADALAGDDLALAGAKRVLTGIDRRQMGPNPWHIESVKQVAVVVAATDPDDEVWRGVAAAFWIDFLNTEVELAANDSDIDVRRDVMALAAAGLAGSADERGELWALVFGRLHESLRRSGTPIGCERTLSGLLPNGPSWDWCGRLRHGLAQVAVQDHWSDADLRAVAAGAGDYANEVAVAVSQLRRGSRSFIDSLIDGVIDGVTWWR